MHVWDTEDLASELSNNELSGDETLLYSFGSLLFSFLGLTVFTWPSSLYRMALGFSKLYFEHKLESSQLFLNVYAYANHHLQMVIWGLMALGIASCYFANKDGKDFLARFICLSWIINIRIIITLSGLFLAALGVVGFMYLPKLMALNTVPFPAIESIGSFFTFMKQFILNGPLKSNLQTMYSAKALFNDLNRMSLYLYYGSNLVTILAISWYFMRIRMYLSKVSGQVSSVN